MNLLQGLGWEQVLTALGGAGAGGILLKGLDILASRRKSAAETDVTISTEARAWVEQFRAEMDAMSARHREEMRDVLARVDNLEKRLTERETRVRELEAENSKLEGEVARLTRRVGELERAGAQGLPPHPPTG